MNGIETEGVALMQDGENKTYQVNCSSDHTTAFAVLTSLGDGDGDDQDQASVKPTAVIVRLQK